MAPVESRKPRLVIYGTGQFGQHVTRFAVQKGWPVVAAFNRAGPKVGQDLGRLAGLDRDLGVIVQDCEAASYDGLDADIGVVTTTDRLARNLPAYTRLMNAGLNVVCHGTEAYFPFGSNPEVAAEVDALAKRNKVTFTGGGIWDMSRIWAGILVAGPCTELNHLHHSSITNAMSFGKALMLLTGVGMKEAEYKEKIAGGASPLVGLYKTIPEHVLYALGYALDGTTEHLEPIFFDEPIFCPPLERDIPTDECVGTRIVVAVKTKEGVTSNAHIELRLFKEGEEEHMFWAVDGLPHTRVRTERDDSSHASASCLFNRIPDVIAAPPGVVLLSQMGPLKHTALQ